MQEDLTELCQELHNWFETKKFIGRFTIEKSKICGNFKIANGQYFRIIGSVFNDGIYKYPAENLIDETFDGAIWAMAIPQSIVKLAKEIADWNEKYGDVLNSPYTSESFKGYSRTKAEVGISWKTAFKDKLNRWRKV